MIPILGPQNGFKAQPFSNVIHKNQKNEHFKRFSAEYQIENKRF